MSKYKKGSKPNSTNNSPGKHYADNDEDKLMVKFVFEGEKFHARIPICFDTLTIKDLTQRTTLDISLPPPNARQLFEAYFKDDIHPYIRHNIASQIRNKRDVAKLWDLQSIILQNIYKERAKLLKSEWLKRRKIQKQSELRQNDAQQESLRRKKAELKAKNKAHKQKWKDEIASQIASGKFDEIQPSKKQKKEDQHHKKPPKQQKKQNQKKKNTKQKSLKASKKKKVKKWKDKRSTKLADWPTMTKNANSAVLSGVTPKKTLKKIAAATPTLNDKAQNGLKPNGFHQKLIHSEVKFKFLLRRKHAEYLWDDEMNQKHIESLANYINNVAYNDLVLIKIWIYLQNIRKQQMLLKTDKEHVLLMLNKVKLFEILWMNFGPCFKKRIDTQHTRIVFVKKSKILRLKIPILPSSI